KLSDRECGNFNRSRAIAAPTWAWPIRNSGWPNLPCPIASAAPLRPFAQLSGTLCPTAVACSSPSDRVLLLGIRDPTLLPGGRVRAARVRVPRSREQIRVMPIQPLSADRPRLARVPAGPETRRSQRGDRPAVRPIRDTAAPPPGSAVQRTQ